MKKYLYEIIIIGLLIGCGPSKNNNSSTTNQTSRNDSTKVMDSIIYVDPIHPNGSKSIERFYDTIVNEIIIGNRVSIDKKLGNDFPIVANIPDSNEQVKQQRALVLNSSKNQLLTVYFLLGDDDTTMLAQFQVEYSNAAQIPKNQVTKISDSEFITGKKIKLGLFEKDLIDLFGNPSEKSKEGNLTKYSYQEYDGFYYGDYYFKKGRLVKFKFGREFRMAI